MLIIGPSHHSLGFLRGGGDGGTETGARTRTGKDGDLGEKKRRDTGRGAGAAADSSGLAGHSGRGHWCEGRGAQSRNRVGSGLAGYRTKPSLFHPRPCWGSQRLSGTSAGYRIRSTGGVQFLWWPRRFRAMASSKSRRAIYPGTNSTSLDINRVFRSGFIYGGGDDYVQPWVLGGGKRLHLARPFFISLLFLPSEQTWRRGGRGGRIESARVWGLFFMRKVDGQWTVERCNGRRPVSQ